MKKEQLLKAGLIFGGGYILFMIIKSIKEKQGSSTKSFLGDKKSADGSAVTPDPANAKIVQAAYQEAITAGESPARLSELNKECMKEFGMRCYVDESGSIIVSDVNGNTII
jgi:hypothetical protein